MIETIRSIAARFARNILLGAGLVAIYMLSAQYTFRVDATDDQLYSLSPYTKELIQQLKKPIRLNLYMTDHVPSHIQPIRQHIQDILFGYQIHSNGIIRFETFKPDMDSLLRVQANQWGIPTIQFNQIKQDQNVVVDGMMGIGLFYNDKVEVIPIVESLESLEYEVTLAIRRLIIEEPKAVTIISTSMSNILTQYQRLISELEKRYIVNKMTFDQLSNTLNAQTVVMLDPPHLTRRQLYTIDQYIMTNGRLLVLADHIKTNMRNQVPIKPTNLNEILSQYGVEINTDLVVDPEAAQATFLARNKPISMRYPLWPKLQKELYANHPVMAGIGSVQLPWASSLSHTPPRNYDSHSIILAKSSMKSWTITDVSNVSPRQTFSTNQATQSHPMIIQLSGSFLSAFNPEISGWIDPESHLWKSPDTLITVIGDSQLIADAYVNQFPDNLNVVLGLIDQKTLDESIIDIQNRSQKDRSLRSRSAAEKIGAISLAYLGVPMLIIAMAGLRRWRRYNRAIQSNDT